ncbi:hypothetical protein NAT51_04590 [Flavobacterium amniphilum]|uniref:hypothetical protein n=1 Tax=Flavobacterium amniphilum TaxID=1834035 RepID=UPI00202A0F4B|nr:hypothetical protein [Flavobacterium amniphilum]MCL9804785.1 hypothetical protein [Flavobacterium amniphilum]
MMQEKKERFAEILYKEVQTLDVNAVKSFSIELMEKDTESANTILFSSLNEAVEIISSFAGTAKKEEIREDILSYISLEELKVQPSFRLKISVGEASILP